MLAVAGILLTAIIFLLKTIFEQGWCKNINAPLLLFAMLIITWAIVKFLNVIRIKAFKRIKYEALVFNTELEKKSVEVESRLIVSYEEALKENIDVVNDIVKIFKSGTFLITVSIYMLISVLLIILLTNFKIFVGDTV